MKFYDLEWLANKCGTDNKYEITVKVAAEARRESEEIIPDKDKNDPAGERFISNVLLEIEEDKSPISVNYQPPKTPAQKIQVFDDVESKDTKPTEAKTENKIEDDDDDEELDAQEQESETEAEAEKSEEESDSDE
ncbi:MAG: hypothetical protein IJS40_03540 [Synergistaceae bacterium]|nr:hypothetical protein [Synergistaceae bacterium]